MAQVLDAGDVRPRRIAELNKLSLANAELDRDRAVEIAQQQKANAIAEPRGRCRRTLRLW